MHTIPEAELSKPMRVESWHMLEIIRGTTFSIVYCFLVASVWGRLCFRHNLLDLSHWVLTYTLYAGRTELFPRSVAYFADPTAQ